MTFLYMLRVCVLFFNSEEMFTPAQLQDGEPSLSTVCNLFNTDLFAAQFLADISYIVSMKRRSYMVTSDSLVANGYTF